MARTPNVSLSGIYAKLVGLYPDAYRKKYGQPMVQTFDDMLVDQPSKIGKLVIWARALWDMPGSILREHLTNGKGFKMDRNLKILISGVVVVLVLANAVSYWFGNLHARQVVAIKKVTPVQLADAMKQDGFYSTYGDEALLFSGKVTNVEQDNGITVATFETGRTYSLQCQFKNTKVKVNETLSVAAPGGSADRLSHGVLLHNCVTN